MMDFPSQEFEATKNKLPYMAHTIQRALQDACRGKSMSQAAARVAGLILSVKDAVHMPPLYIRLLFQALVCHDWDIPLPAAASVFAFENLHYWAGQISFLKGKTWVRRNRVQFLAGDASESAFGGFLELVAAPINVGFDLSDRQLMAAGQVSSTLQENKCARLCL